MKYGKHLKRYTAAAVLVTMLAGSVSAVSYAFDRYSQALNEEGDWTQKIKAGRYNYNEATPSSATPSSLSGKRSAKGNKVHGLATPGNMLGQTGDNEAALESIEVEWFRVLLDNEVIRDSSRPHLEMDEGKEIPPDGKITLKLRVIFYVNQGKIEPGNYVEWKLGTYPGLALPEAISEDIVINRIPFGYAYLHYDEDGGVFLGTVFDEEVEKHGAVYVEYTYESGFVPVCEKTPLNFRFPGREEERTAMLLPADCPEPEESGPEVSEPTTPMPTVPETSVPEMTEPETTAPETSVPETPAPETSPGRPSGGGSSGGESGSSSGTSQPAETLAEPTEALREEEPEAAELETIESESAGEVPEAAKTPAPDMAERGQEKQAEEQQIEVRISNAAGADGEAGAAVKNGDILTCTIEVRNGSSTQAKDIRLREYLPDHVSFLSASGGGIWAIQDGRQRITWKLDELEAGESRTFEVRLLVNPCTPSDYSLEQIIFWQDEDRESVHSPKDPEQSIEAPGIIVG